MRPNCKNKASSGYTGGILAFLTPQPQQRPAQPARPAMLPGAALCKHAAVEQEAAGYCCDAASQELSASLEMRVIMRFLVSMGF